MEFNRRFNFQLEYPISSAKHNKILRGVSEDPGNSLLVSSKRVSIEIFHSQSHLIRNLQAI